MEKFGDYYVLLLLNNTNFLKRNTCQKLVRKDPIFSQIQMVRRVTKLLLASMNHSNKTGEWIIELDQNRCSEYTKNSGIMERTLPIKRFLAN